jgi:hypothetical protein
MMTYGRRDQTGRAPRASTRMAFYQAIADRDANGPTRPIEEPTTETQTPHTVEPRVEALYRGGGSGY